MAKLITTLNNLWRVSAFTCVTFSYALTANALTTPEEAANEAVVKRILEVKGTPAYRAVAKEVFAPDHKVLRNEFESLIYNADDPVLKAASEPDYQAITERTNTIERLFGDGDLVAAMIRVQGKHTGNLYGIPATGKNFDIKTTAVFKLANGKITESWYLSEEANLLMDLDVPLPKRVDGRANLPPIYDDVRTFDEALAEHVAKPADTAEWRNKALLLSYKSQPENRVVKWEGKRPYSNMERGGIDDIVARAKVLGVKGSHGESMSGRRDMIGYTIANDDQGMIVFRLTAENTGPLYGIPAGGHELHDWEVGFARFDDDSKWTDAWWLAEELNFVLTVGGQDGSPESLNFFGEQK
jgi:predicted ester cyclase